MSNDTHDTTAAAGLNGLAPEYVRTHLREIASAEEGAPWLAQLAEEQADRDKVTEHRALLDYKLITPPGELSFSGWQEYKIRRGLPFLATDVEEPRFWEIMQASNMNVEAPTSSAPRHKRAPAAPATEEERRARISLCRGRIMREHGAAIEEARAAGWLVGWRWQGRGNMAGPLYLWLLETGISQQSPTTNEVSWNIVDGVFENKDGNPITRGSLSASKSAKEREL